MPYDRGRHGPVRVVGPGFHEDVFRIVKCIPAGKVCTYGDIATAFWPGNHTGHVSRMPRPRPTRAT